MNGCRNIIIISDTHCGCRLGLCPPKIKLDDGGWYYSSVVQQKVYEVWIKEFWETWVPMVTHGDKYAVIVNGDIVDGAHHNSKHQISHNYADQANITYQLFAPIVDSCEGRFYMLRGTEAHVGQSAEQEEQIGRVLGSVPNEEGQYTRYEMWAHIEDRLVHIMHHIGTTGSAAYETTALMKEFAESCAEAGRWNIQAPNIVVRSHRHRHSSISVPTAYGEGICFTTAGWQLRTPFSYRIPGGRITTPQIGGSVIRLGDEDLYARHMIRNIGRSKEVVLA